MPILKTHVIIVAAGNVAGFTRTTDMQIEDIAVTAADMEEMTVSEIDEVAGGSGINLKPW